jgi:four helix bundle protein
LIEDGSAARRLGIETFLRLLLWYGFDSASWADCPMAYYRRLLAWQAADEMATTAYRVTASWPSQERFGMISQLRRAAVSAPTNIVEGSARRGRREFRLFLGYALASLAEVEYLLQLALQVGVATDDDEATLAPLIKRAGQLTYRLLCSM